jgi:hypothetical protein
MLTQWGTIWQMIRVFFISYILLRMGMFNVLYNKFRDRKYWYIGSGKGRDKIFDKWIKWMADADRNKKYQPLLTIFYIACAAIGFFLL